MTAPDAARASVAGKTNRLGLDRREELEPELDPAPEKREEPDEPELELEDDKVRREMV